MRGITRLLYAAGLVVIMATASACGGRAESTDPEQIFNQESSFTDELESTDPANQDSDPVENP